MATLTAMDWKDINLAMTATSMLTESEIDDIASWLNGKIGLPFLSEKTEQKVIAKIVKRVDEFLYDNLPNEYYELIRMSANGISDEDAEVIKSRLAELINGVVNIPLVSEKTEGKILKALIGLLVDAMRESADLGTELAKPYE